MLLLLGQDRCLWLGPLVGWQELSTEGENVPMTVAVGVVQINKCGDEISYKINRKI